MNKLSLRLSWRRGWHALFAIVLFNLTMAVVGAVAKQVLPELWWVRVPVLVALVVLIAPVVAWTAIRFVFPGAQPLPTLHPVEVASFSDEGSAQVVVSALEQGGVRAVVSSGAVGPLSGLPMPVGSVKVLVSEAQLAEARSLLASIRSSKGPRAS